MQARVKCGSKYSDEESATRYLSSDCGDAQLLCRYSYQYYTVVRSVHCFLRYACCQINRDCADWAVDRPEWHRPLGEPLAAAKFIVSPDGLATTGCLQLCGRLMLYAYYFLLLLLLIA
jgi:hypothetical protein